MNFQYDILLLGPEGPERDRLSNLLGDLGHRVAAEPASAGDCYDVALVDLRAGEVDSLPGVLRGLDPELPLLALASEAEPAMRALRGRVGMVLIGADRPCGYQVALAVCPALARRRVPVGSVAHNGEPHVLPSRLAES